MIIFMFAFYYMAKFQIYVIKCVAYTFSSILITALVAFRSNVSLPIFTPNCLVAESVLNWLYKYRHRIE